MDMQSFKVSHRQVFPTRRDSFEFELGMYHFHFDGDDLWAELIGVGAGRKRVLEESALKGYDLTLISATRSGVNFHFHNPETTHSYCVEFGY